MGPQNGQEGLKDRYFEPLKERGIARSILRDEPICRDVGGASLMRFDIVAQLAGCLLIVNRDRRFGIEVLRTGIDIEGSNERDLRAAVATAG